MNDMAAGKSPAEIQRQMRHSGIDATTARRIVDNAQAALLRHNLPTAQPTIVADIKSKLRGLTFLCGLFLLIMGVGITGFSYLMAPRSGVYVIAWEAIVVGIILILRGIFPKAAARAD